MAAKDVTGAQESNKPEKLSVRVKEHKHVSVELPIPTSTPNGNAKGRKSADEDGDVFKTPMERRHITFDDSDHDDDEFVTPREAPLKDPLEEVTEAKNVQKGKEAEDDDENEDDEEESDDDEAPEAISTHAAEAQTAQAAKAAVAAAKKQAASERKKRQERDAFFKQQAEEKRAKEAADKEAKEQEAVPEAPVPVAGKRKREVPKLLPLHLLESDDEDSDEEQLRPIGRENFKRMKLDAAMGLLPEKKPPKDKKVGSTVLRVVKERADQRLAPRMHKQSLRVRELLLKRDKKPERKRGSSSYRE
ncbi:hypothetical protein QBC37DRAFT_280315 [Rhypophila decipiens]|uniref:Uncharacterized protein n=1 Tax=Rhypophila decipiens TaxID=261697 RepID=A0AAN6YB63_9PEZI|nr:hypothetical protein QBC37DRAFT_280315 [Rhypophila decipiens]